jgi:hypothetical protein
LKRVFRNFFPTFCKAKAIKILSGTSSPGSLDTHDETVDGDKGERAQLGMEHESIFPGCARRHGKVFGDAQ